MKCKVLIDWLTFSVKKDNPSEVIWEYLGLDPALFQDAGICLMGYSKVLRFSDIFVCYAPREDGYFKDMGICVSMSGNGCRTFENMSRLSAKGAKGQKDSSFQELFRLLAEDETSNVSRIDVACDDHSGYLDMDDIIGKIMSNDVNSRLRKRSVVFSMDGSKKDGATVYIGSPSSDFRVRIYDKALEQGVEDHWIRVELVMRSANANAFVEHMTGAEDVGKLAAQVINDKFSFIERDDSNITRCTVCSWWVAFVDELIKVRLVSREAIQHSVSRIRDWLINQVSPSLFVIMQTMGISDILNFTASAAGRISSRQEALIVDFNSVRSAMAAHA